MVYNFSRIFNATVSDPKLVRRNLIEAISPITDLDPYISPYSLKRIKAGEIDGYAIETNHAPDGTFEILVTISTNRFMIMSLAISCMERMGFYKLD